MYGASVCHLRHLGPDRITSTDGSSINVFFYFLLFTLFPPLRFPFPFRFEMTPLALLAWCPTGAVSPPSALGACGILAWWNATT